MTEIADVLKATIANLNITPQQFVEALIVCAIQIDPSSRDVDNFIRDIVDELKLDIEVPNLYLEALEQDAQ